MFVLLSLSYFIFSYSAIFAASVIKRSVLFCDKLSTSLVVGVVKMLHCHIVCDKLSTSLVVGVVNCHIV